MSERVYILLDVIDGKSADVVQALRTNSGVVIADSLEGHPNTIVMLEAPDRQRLAELMIPILSSVDGFTEDVHLLVTRRENVLAAA